MHAWLSLAVRASLLAAAMLAGAPALHPAHAQATSALSVIVFPGGFNWPLFAGQAKGFFRSVGLEVTLTPTPSSSTQMQGLIEGRFDLAMTAIDNVIAYEEGQGEATIAPPASLAAIMGGDNGFLSLVTSPDIHGFADLRGKTLAVDALTTGYAFVLLEMLRQNNLWPGGVTLRPFGGVAARWITLQQRQHDGTILITPFEIIARNAGFNVLARAPDVVGRYQGLVAAVRRDRAAQNREQITNYLVGYLRAVGWLYDPANRDEALAILRQNVPQLTEQLAAASYEILLNPTSGFTRRGEIDIEGVRTVLALRSRFAQPAVALGDPAKYIDLSYHTEALRRIAAQ